MARGVNRVILIGNLGRDPESRATQGGVSVCNFSIATSETWKDKNTGDTQERTEWHSIVAFNRLAEICSEYLRKGSKVYVEGSLRTTSWESDGVMKYRTEIVCREMQMLGTKAMPPLRTCSTMIRGVLNPTLLWRQKTLTMTYRLVGSTERVW